MAHEIEQWRSATAYLPIDQRLDILQGLLWRATLEACGACAHGDKEDVLLLLPLADSISNLFNAIGTFKHTYRSDGGKIYRAGRTDPVRVEIPMPDWIKKQ